jgi:hypothetical protein
MYAFSINFIIMVPMYVVAYISIVFYVKEVSINETSAVSLSPIQGDNAEIIIPLREVLAGLESGAEVRMAALLFRNMSGLLPDSTDHDSEDIG